MALDEIRRDAARSGVEYAGRMAKMGSVRGLILSDNVIIGHQIASLLHDSYGWSMQAEHLDRSAYSLIRRGEMDVVIADIDAEGLGGLAVLVYAKQHRPSVMTFGISQGHNPYLHRLARDMGGCQGFFYRVEGRLKIDTRIGMAAQLLHRGTPADRFASPMG